MRAGGTVSRFSVSVLRVGDIFVGSVTSVPTGASPSRFVLKIGHPETTLPVPAPLEYHRINIQTVSTVPSHLTSAVKKPQQ